jgi:hypothetical protein
VPTASADTVTFKDGTVLEGIILKVEAGEVTLEVSGEPRFFNILDVTSMDFTTPHVLPFGGEAVDHFLSNIEAQEIVSNLKEIEEAAAEISRKLTQIEGYWEAKEPIAADELGGWDLAKETFRKPVDRYQELLNDLYFHVLAKVDEYNKLMDRANHVYVGVKGAFNVGSPLVPKDLEKLPLRKYVPGAWYDTIYFTGYDHGYEDAYLKFGNPYTQQTNPDTSN